MKCILCNCDTRVLESRAAEDGIRRRRECIVCGERFTTMETMVGKTLKAAPASRPKPVAKPKAKPKKPVATPKQRLAARRAVEDRMINAAVNDNFGFDDDPLVALRGY